MEIIKFWAKTTHNKDKFPNAYHPLICHLIDVAVVTKKIWDDVLPRATKERIARSFGETNFDEESLEKIGLIIALIAGLHDLGKISPPFTLRGIGIEDKKTHLENKLAKEIKNESSFADRIYGKLQTIYLLDLYRNTSFWTKNVSPVKDAPHGYVTAVELPEILQSEKFGFNKNFAKQISTMIGGHHGTFPNSDWDKIKTDSSKVGNDNWKNVRMDLVNELTKLFKIKPISQSKDAKLDNGTIMILAGLVSVAD